MASGRQNKLAGQIAEHLVCAELGRRDLIATPFAGNVPAFDVIAADDQCRTVPLQIKATRGSSWPTDARLWLDLQFEATTRVQHNGGMRSLSNPDLIYVCVALHAPGDVVHSDLPVMPPDHPDRCKDPWIQPFGIEPRAQVALDRVGRIAQRARTLSDCRELA